MLQLKNINKIYKSSSKATFHAIKHVSLNFESNGFVFIQGKSGCGKSTLLNILGGLDSFDSGEYKIFGKEVSKFSKSEWDEFRNYYFGFIFQEFLLLSELTVKDNVAFALELQGEKKDVSNKVTEILQKVGLLECANRKVNELSGGQRQRVAIARALIKNPKVILADEPTGNLDEATSDSIYKLLEKLSEEYLIILVTHDNEAAQRYADRIIVLRDGVVESDEKNAKVCYDLKISNNKSEVASFDNLNETEIAKIFKNNINSNSEQYHLTVERKEVLNEKVKSVKNEKSTGVLKKSTLRNKSALNFALKSMGRHKLKTVFTLIFFILTMFLLYFATYAAMFDVNEPIKNYMSKYDIQNVYVYRNVEFKNEFSQSLSEKIKSGKHIKEDLQNIFGKNNIYGMNVNIPIKNNDWEVRASVTYIDDNYKLAVVGNLPEKNREIVLTDYIIEKLSLGLTESIGKTVTLSGESYKIVGYVKTDYIEYEYADKLGSQKYVSYASERGSQIYERAYVSVADVVPQRNEPLEIKAADFVNYRKESLYVKSINSFGSLDWLNSKTIENGGSLIWGRKPTAKNEVVISDDYAGVSNFGTKVEMYEKNSKKTYKFLDIFDNKFNGYNDSNMNMSEIMPGEIKVVGVYSAKKATGTEKGAYALIPQEFYLQAVDEFYENNYYAEYECFSGNGDYFQIVRQCADLNLEFGGINFSIIYAYDDLIKGLIFYIVVILVILMIITIFMIISFVSFSIKDNGKVIGIFKALGIANKDVVKIFVIESIIMCIITLLGSIALHFVGLNFINAVVESSMLENALAVFYYNYINISIVAGCTFFVFFVSAFFPILSIANKKPMEAIRNN